MSQTIQALLRHLHGTDPDGDPADADLLGRFAARRDGAAFAALVARHGPMVLGVCRRLLGNPHDAEDAFQATFLVLARRAGALRPADPVGAWLHGVACRTAAHARAARARRRECERGATPMGASEAAPEILWEDLRPVLDEEVGRLPDEYRVPVVLCYLGGLTYAEAAREIGCPKGTVASRLAKARDILRDRLSGRGVSLPTAGLVAVLADNARASLPVVLFRATVEAATTSAAPPAVAAIAAEVLKAMAGPKLKVVTALLVAAGLLAAGAGALAFRTTTGNGNPGGGAPALKGVPAAGEPPWGVPDAGVQVRLRTQRSRWSEGEIPAFDLDVRNRGEKAVGLVKPTMYWEVEFDGTWYGRKLEKASLQLAETPLNPGSEAKAWVALDLSPLWLRGVTGGDRYTSRARGEGLPLTPGKHTVRVAYHPPGDLRPVSNLVEIEVVAANAGGKDDPGWIHVRTNTADKVLLFRPDGTGRTEARAAHPETAVPSPDGKSVLHVHQDNDLTAVHVADADGKNSRQVSPDGVLAHSPVWSPDGKRVAFLGLRDGKLQVHVANRDGRDLRQVTDGTTAPHGADLPKFGAGGRLVYLVLGERVGKRQPADLVVGEGKDARAVVRGEVIADHAWSPDGTVIAYSRPGAVVFHDVGAGKGREVALADVDGRLADHAARPICWSPDGRAVACLAVYWGGRKAGTKMFGDDEVFVIPRAGKPTWFRPGEPFRGLEWVRGDAPGAAEPPAAAGDWSEPVNGLRGRLVLVDGPLLADGKARETPVYVELETVGAAGADREVYFDSDRLRCKLTHADGRAAPEHPTGGSGGRGGPPAAWVTLPYDSAARLRANPAGYAVPDGRMIRVATGNWVIKAGDPGAYLFSGRLTVAPPAGHDRANAWAGKLELPPVTVRAFAAAGAGVTVVVAARPTVTDPATGVTVTVQADGRTIAARGRDGKALWEADVIKAAGPGHVGAPVVRELILLKAGQVTAVFGKHSYAEFDLPTGKFLGAGSD